MLTPCLVRSYKPVKPAVKERRKFSGSIAVAMAKDDFRKLSVKIAEKWEKSRLYGSGSDFSKFRNSLLHKDLRYGPSRT